MIKHTFGVYQILSQRESWNNLNKEGGTLVKQSSIGTIYNVNNIFFG